MNNSAQPDRWDGARDRHGAEFLRSNLLLNFVTVWVRDQERSLRFFVDQLGFQVAVDSDVPGVGRWIIATPPNGLPGIALTVPLDGTTTTRASCVVRTAVTLRRSSCGEMAAWNRSSQPPR
jgi:hypothetical protein